MINYIISVSGLIISTLGIIQVLQSYYFEKPVRRYFLWIFSILIAYAASNLLSWATYGIPSPGGILASKTALFLESVLSCGLILLMTDFLLYVSGDENRRKNRIFQINAALFTVYFVLLVYAQFSTTIYYYDDLYIYHRGAWYPVLLVPPITMIILNLWLLRSRRTKLSRRRIIAFASYMLIPGLSMVIQLFLSGNTIVLGAAVAAFIMLAYLMSDQAEQYYRQQAENSKLRAEILLSQIQPHFLFNTLGTISHLCTDSPEAKDAILLFSRYLRGNIDVLSHETQIPFAREAEHTKLYLELEKLRFGDSLQVSWDLACTGFRIPSLTLQPLVENAVRHGVRGNPDGCGTVRISSEDCSDHYEIRVEDDGPGFPSENTQAQDGKTHVGIENVKERLRIVCGGKLEISSVPGRGTRITIILPKEHEA
ncbi:MAG: histidine kinase [Clostridia bacterium]|nr:histidine kinase [Clostridia bacterium]